ncbi:MAG: FCD domain-containing protein [Arthrobacter sp.]|nr:FCD domain-containing protein [Arthrobacter sp.]
MKNVSSDASGANTPGEGMADPPLDPGVLLRPNHAANAFEETVHSLLQTIRLGVIGPGQRLPAERELAVMLGVSRDTLRDAMGSLAEAGYVVAKRGRYGGTFVADPVPGSTPVVGIDGGLRQRESVPASEVDDALVLRRVLEVGAAKQAAAAAVPAAAARRLEVALAECSEAPLEDYRRLDARLHLLVAELSGSMSVLRLVAEVRMRVNELLDRIPLLPPNIQHSNEQHEALVRAIVAGDADAAARVMEEHVAGSEALLRGFLT